MMMRAGVVWLLLGVGACAGATLMHVATIDQGLEADDDSDESYGTGDAGCGGMPPPTGCTFEYCDPDTNLVQTMRATWLGPESQVLFKSGAPPSEDVVLELDLPPPTVKPVISDDVFLLEVLARDLALGQVHVQVLADAPAALSRNAERLVKRLAPVQLARLRQLRDGGVPDAH